MDHFATDFQEFKVSSAERMDNVEHLILENITEHGTLKTKDRKQQVELLQNKNVFGGAASMTLNNYILPTLQEDQPCVAVLHIGLSNINNQIKDKINTEKLTEDVIKIGKCCIDFSMK